MAMWVSGFGFFGVSEYLMYTLIFLICICHMVCFQLDICLEEVLVYADQHGGLNLSGVHVMNKI